MSDYSVFESDEAAQAEPRLAARTAARKLESAIEGVRRSFGQFLVGATGIDEFEDRWHLSKHDIRASVEPLVFPNTGTMRRIKNAMKADWKLAHPYKLALDHDEAGFGSMPTADHERNLHTEETFHPSSGNLIPDGNFEGYKDSVDQNGPEKVQRDFTPGGDSGSDRHAARGDVRGADPLVGSGEGYYGGDFNPDMSEHLYDSGLSPYTPDEAKHEFYRDMMEEPPAGFPRRERSPFEDREAAALVADIYTDFAQTNGLRVASLDTLDHYASTGIAEADYRLLQSMIIRAAEEAEESEEEPEEDDEDDHEEPDADNAGGPSDGDEDNEDDDDESDEGDDDDEDYDFGGGDDQGGESGGGQSYTVPEQAPDLDPQMLNEIPHDDTDGTAPVPPNVIDSLLGLPEGTIEQLLLQEVEQGQGGAPEQGGAPDFGGGDAPQGGGDDFFGGGGGDNTEPPRVARRRQAGQVVDGVDWDDAFRNTVQEWPNWAPSQRKEFMEQALAAGVKRPQYHQDADYRIKNYDENNSSMPKKPLPQASRLFWAAPDESEGELRSRHYQQYQDSLDAKFGPTPTAKPDIQDLYKRAQGGDGDAYATLKGLYQQRGWTAARRFWAADDDQSGGGDQAPPPGDPSQGGGDPAAMGGGQPMMPPPGSQSVAPPQPPMPLENQPAEDALLDTANQAIMQMIDRETQEYQQIIGPLSQALQAVQFAQQVEQSEHPMDVTPPQGTVNVDPSQAPGGAGNPMQPTARRRYANDDPYAQSYGPIDRGGPSIDDPSNGPTYQRVHPDIEKALRRRFDGGGSGAWHPDKPDTIIHDLGNFWDGPRTVRHLGGGELEYTNPWNGESDRFNPAGYYTREGEHRPWSTDHYSSRREAKKVRVLKNAARLIAKTYGVNSGMLIEAMGRRNYEHVAEAFRILPPAALQSPEVRAAASHVGKMFAAENPMFNHDVWMESVIGGRTAATGRDRYENKSYTESRDKGRAEHERQDLGSLGWFGRGVEEEPLPPGANRETHPHKFGPENPDHAYHHGSRLPFDRPRLAGETLKNTPTMDRFEFANEQPEITDNMTINDLPKHTFKGLPKMKANQERLGWGTKGISPKLPKMPSEKRGDDVMGKYQRYTDQRAQNGLNFGDNDVTVEDFINEKHVGTEAGGKLHDQLGISHPPQPKATTPKMPVPKAKNPVTKRGTWGEWEPTREASFFTRRVPGWRWDDHLSGYISKEARDFACSCGQKVASPSYKTCDCGKIWNVYAIGSQHHLASDTADMFIAREIPVRDNVIMANRKMASYGGATDHAYQGPALAPEIDYCMGATGGGDCGLPASLHSDFERDHPEAIRNKNINEIAEHQRRKEAKGDCTCWEGYERVPGTKPCADGSCRKCDSHKKESRTRSHAELVAMIDKLADWTKYDGPDPARELGKDKPASTDVPSPPKDWATRLPKGDPSKKGGTWTPPTIPRKKK